MWEPEEWRRAVRNCGVNTNEKVMTMRHHQRRESIPTASNGRYSQVRAGPARAKDAEPASGPLEPLA